MLVKKVSPDSVKIEWLPPLRCGEVQNYVVEALPGQNEGRWVNVGNPISRTTRCVVSGLSEHDMYKFRVFARCRESATGELDAVPTRSARQRSSRATSVPPPRLTRTRPCRYCRRRFKTDGQLMTHVRVTHGQGRNLRCSVCWASFKTARNLRVDMMCHYRHWERGSFESPSGISQCTTCGSQFDSVIELVEHKAMVHKAYEPCLECRMFYKCKSQLYGHQRALHRYLCQECAESFTAASFLRVHVTQQHGAGTCCGGVRENADEPATESPDSGRNEAAGSFDAAQAGGERAECSAGSPPPAVAVYMRCKCGRELHDLPVILDHIAQC